MFSRMFARAARTGTRRAFSSSSREKVSKNPTLAELAAAGSVATVGVAMLGAADMAHAESPDHIHPMVSGSGRVDKKTVLFFLSALCFCRLVALLFRARQCLDSHSSSSSSFSFHTLFPNPHTHARARLTISPVTLSIVNTFLVICLGNALGSFRYLLWV